MVLDDGVANISRSRLIAAQPQAIWDVLADFGAISSWADDVDHSSLLNHGPDGGLLGTTRRVQMGRTAVVERITVLDAPATIAYDIEGLPRVLGKVANSWTLRQEGDVTDVTLTSTVVMGQNPLASAAEWVVLRGLARTTDSLLAGLANRMEKAA
jgi:Polyketide cyclase / dehydrase and lipid transport